MACAGTVGDNQPCHPYRLPYIANALVNPHIGLEEADDGVWAIYFNTVLLATLDERDFIIRG